MASDLPNINNSFLRVNSFSDLEELTAGGKVCTEFRRPDCLKVPGFSGSLPLEAIVNRVQRIYASHPISADDRKPLGELSSRLFQWNQDASDEIRENCRNNGICYSLFYSLFDYRRQPDVFFWSTDEDPKIDNHYTIEEWQEEFPGKEMPELNQRSCQDMLGGTKRYIFTDEEIARARS